MGLFGGGNSKTSSSTTNTEQTVANYGNGPATTLNLSNVGTGTGNVSIATTDYGAVEAGTNLARDALKGALDSVSGIASSVVDKTLSLANKTQVSEPAQMQDTYVKIALIAGAAVALVMIFKKG